MALNTGGSYNTATGVQALHSGGVTENTATGFNALFYNFGSYNTADGSTALYNNQLGNSNTAVGHLALADNYSGSNNIALGASAGVYTTGSDNIDLGDPGLAGESGVMRLGTEGTQAATYIAGIRASGLAVATAVGITDDGRLGVRASSKRYKDSIKPLSKGSEVILSLRPVSFRYKKDLDPRQTIQFGLVAEEVAKVAPDLVATDEEGKPFTVRYDEVNAMLLNEFLKEHKKVEAQGREIAELKARLTDQATLLQKISARLDAAGPTARLVENR
jgi:hypothetical protein